MDVQAFRTVDKMILRSERLNAQIEGAAADRGFDAGEFSGAFHADVIQELIDGIYRTAAAAYDIDADFLQQEHTAWSFDGVRKMQEAYR